MFQERYHKRNNATPEKFEHRSLQIDYHVKTLGKLRDRVMKSISIPCKYYIVSSTVNAYKKMCISYYR